MSAPEPKPLTAPLVTPLAPLARRSVPASRMTGPRLALAPVSDPRPRADNAQILPPRLVAEARTAVALVDADLITRAGLRALVDDLPALTLVADVDDVDAALSVLPQDRPSVLLLESAMAAESRGAAIRKVLTHVAHAQVLVFGPGTLEEELHQVFSAGAAGYILRSRLCAELIPAVRAITAGGRYFPPEVQHRLLERGRRPALTPRERDVLTLLGEARCNATIAAVLGISVGTVKLHVRAILAKLGAEDRVEALVLAVQRGLVQVR